MNARRWETLGEEAVRKQHWPRILAALEAGRSAGEWIELDGTRGYLKYAPLRGKASLRHAVRHRLGLRLPRLAEFGNLTWLRSSGFSAPRPLLAGAAFAGGRPTFQFLLSEEIPAPTLRSVFEGPEGPERGSILTCLGATLAHLHGLGFVHRDAFPRNILVESQAGSDGAPRIAWLDAWRGGLRRGLRGPTYDIACLMLFAPTLFSEEEQELLLRAYFGAAAEAGLRLEPRAALSRVVRQRRALAQRFLARGRGSGGRLAAPALEWAPPGNLAAGPP